jgi:2-oxoglutarate dehydrogenase complex dehydrogenase (E1) component-like enzyme
MTCFGTNVTSLGALPAMVISLDFLVEQLPLLEKNEKATKENQNTDDGDQERVKKFINIYRGYGYGKFSY